MDTLGAIFGVKPGLDHFIHTNEARRKVNSHNKGYVRVCACCGYKATEPYDQVRWQSQPETAQTAKHEISYRQRGGTQGQRRGRDAE